MFQVRHIPPHLHPQPVHRLGRRDVQGSVILISPRKIRRLLRQRNRPQMMSSRIPHPDSLGPVTYKFPCLSTLIPSGTPSPLAPGSSPKMCPFSNDPSPATSYTRMFRFALSST